MADAAAVTLRPAAPADADALARLGRDAFCAAFEHLYAPEDLAAFLNAHKTPETFTRMLADPGKTAMLAVDPAGSFTGYCVLSYDSPYASHSDARSPIALDQLYTDPARTGEGIGAALMDWALAMASRRRADAIQLSVWSENLGAQRFYGRYGFAKVADIDFWVGNHRDDEFLYELRM